jgi:hypothetical protein
VVGATKEKRMREREYLERILGTHQNSGEWLRETTRADIFSWLWPTNKNEGREV